jgi:hypothetical protein
MGEQIKTSQAVTGLEYQISMLEEQGRKGATVSIFSKHWPSAQCGTCTGGDNPPVYEGDANFVYVRNDPSTVWHITHNLNKFPSVTVVDQFGNLVEATVNYPSLNSVIVTFGQMFTGKAFLN